MGKTIVVGVDDSETALKAAAVAADLAVATGSVLHVVTAYDEDETIDCRISRMFASVENTTIGRSGSPSLMRESVCTGRTSGSSMRISITSGRSWNARVNASTPYPAAPATEKPSIVSVF